MSERLSDRRLYTVEGLATGKGALGATARDTRVMAAEIRERRQADLTAEERAHLAYAQEVVRDSMLARHSRHDEACERALAAMSKILAAKESER